MTTITEIQVEAGIEEPMEKKPLLAVLGKLVRRQPLGAAGAAIVIVMLFMSIFAEAITVYDPELNSFENMLAPPGSPMR